MKRWAGWAFLALVLGLTAWGVWRNPGEKARPVYGVRAEAKTFVREVSGEGEVVGRVLRLAFATSGRVAEVYVAKGDRVQAGQTLARLENRELARQLDLARGRLRAARDERARLAAAHRTQKARLTAQIDEARRQLELLRALHAVGSASRNELEKAQEQLEALQLQQEEQSLAARGEARAAENRLREAEAEVKRLERQLKDTHLTAPVDGVVLEVPFAAGEVPGAPLRLLEAGSLVPKARFSQVEGARVRPGQPARIELEVRPDEPIESRVARVLPPEATSGAVRVPVRFAPLEDTQAEPGFTLTAYVTVNRIDDAVVVPLETLVEEGETAYVWIARDARAEKREVTVRDRNLLEAAVTGLEAGTVLVRLPPDDLEDGEKLAVTFESEQP